MFAEDGVDLYQVDTIPPPYNCEGLILWHTTTPYTEEEISWLQFYTYSGGILIVLGEHGNMYRFNEVTNTVLQHAGWETGVTIIEKSSIVDSVHAYPGPTDTTWSLNNYYWFYSTEVEDEPLTYGVDTVAFFATSALELYPPSRCCVRMMSTAVAEDMDIYKYPLISMARIGAGVLIVFGDSNVLRFSDIHAPGDSCWTTADNRQIISNIAAMLHGIFPGVDEAEKPSSYKLSIHPNPFNATCELLGKGSAEVLDITGRTVDRLILPCRWTPTEELPNGIYFIKPQNGEAKRAVLLR